jgi:hypothetical protein
MDFWAKNSGPQATATLEDEMRLAAAAGDPVVSRPFANRKTAAPLYNCEPRTPRTATTVCRSLATAQYCW